EVGITAGAKLPWSASSLTWICNNENIHSARRKVVKLNSTLVRPTLLPQQ
ncbi:hypothetical protein Nmel_001373, partial [Mimus melanotis]